MSAALIRAAALAEVQLAAQAALDTAAEVVERLAALSGSPEPARVPMTVRITKAAHRQLRRAAYERGTSQQALVDQALVRFLDEHGA
jgi:hypothetical protein